MRLSLPLYLLLAGQNSLLTSNETTSQRVIFRVPGELQRNILFDSLSAHPLKEELIKELKSLYANAKDNTVQVEVDCPRWEWLRYLALQRTKIWWVHERSAEDRKFVGPIGRILDEDFPSHFPKYSRLLPKQGPYHSRFFPAKNFTTDLFVLAHLGNAMERRKFRLTSQELRFVPTILWETFEIKVSQRILSFPPELNEKRIERPE